MAKTGKKSKTKFMVIIAAVLAVAIIATLLFVLLRKEKESFEPEAYDSIVVVPEGEAVIILENEVYEKNALIGKSGLFIPYELLEAKFQTVFYTDDNPGNADLTYCLPDRMLRITPNADWYFENGERIETEEPICFEKDGTMYILLSFVDSFAQMEWEFFEKPNRVMFSFFRGEILYNVTKEETPMHSDHRVGSGVIRTLEPGTKLYYVGGFGNKREHFIQVMTEDGVFGFVQRKHVTDSAYEVKNINFPEIRENHMLYEDGKICLGWFVTYSKDGNKMFDEVCDRAKSMNVVSPTWFSVCDNEGTISSRGDLKVVRNAHERGLKVWIMVDYTLDGEVSPHSNLAYDDVRGKLIANLIKETLSLEADGLNIDFEGLSPETGVHFVEFIKELSIACHQNNLILSVDNLIYDKTREHYDMKSQAAFADYIVLMTYDEHYAKSETPGSVASLPFVRRSLNKAAEMVERSRLVMGIPFYTRLWKKENGGLTSTVVSVYRSMISAKDGLYGLPQWDETACQNYYEWKEEDVLCQMWIEDDASISYKMAEFVAQRLGGIACWRLDLENDEIWDIIGRYLNND